MNDRNVRQVLFGDEYQQERKGKERLGGGGEYGRKTFLYTCMKIEQ
jgi:hypothetical protein